MSMTGSYAVHACFLSLIPIKPCIVLIADDNTLLAAPQFVPSDDKLTRIGNILQYGTFGGENCYAYVVTNALHGATQVARCLAWPKQCLHASGNKADSSSPASRIAVSCHVLCSCHMLNIATP